MIQLESSISPESLPNHFAKLSEMTNLVDTEFELCIASFAMSGELMKMIRKL